MGVSFPRVVFLLFVLQTTSCNSQLLSCLAPVCNLLNLVDLLLFDPFTALGSVLSVGITTTNTKWEYRVGMRDDPSRYFSLQYGSLQDYQNGLLDFLICPLLSKVPTYLNYQQLTNEPVPTTQFTWQLRNCGKFRIESAAYNDSATIEVMGESLFIAPSSNKLTIVLSDWPFQLGSNRIRLSMKLAFNSVNSFNVTMGTVGAQKVITVNESDGTIWNYRLLTKVEIDGVTKDCQVTLANQVFGATSYNADLIFDFPSFRTMLRYDPDWSVLMPPPIDASPSSSSSNAAKSTMTSTYFDFPGGDTTSSPLPSQASDDTTKGDGTQTTAPSNPTKTNPTQTGNAIGADPQIQGPSEIQSPSSSFVASTLFITIVSCVGVAIIAIAIGFILISRRIKKKRQAIEGDLKRGSQQNLNISTSSLHTRGSMPPCSEVKFTSP
eukprot:TRINITY_DN15036_c0_g1_i1.p1 TRINITY_DN15036_c0_g1~~TRINITY_DN15036_c0_g1_i1.p1  ORF type:complete len:436 (-),score=78.96 TRINITY_DN15036_c0_g1_i1:39-1346(-)